MNLKARATYSINKPCVVLYWYKVSEERALTGHVLCGS